MINNNEKPKRGIFGKVLGIMALAGVALIILGFVFGGGFGNLGPQDGRLVYTTRNKSIDIGPAPRGWKDGTFNIASNGTMFGFSPRRSSKNTNSFNYNGVPEGVNDGEVVDLGDVSHLSVDIGCGYVSIIPGTKASLQVSGPLEASVYNHDGKLVIESPDLNGVTTERVGSIDHYFQNGVDITTWYTIILPTDIDALELELALGRMDVSGFSMDYLTASTDLGGIQLDNITVDHAELATSLGGISATGFEADSVHFDIEMGGINFEGSVKTYVSADIEMGALYIEMPDPGEFNYIIDSEAGAVNINGKAFAGIFGGNTTRQNDDAAFTFDISCSGGAADIQFT